MVGFVDCVEEVEGYDQDVDAPAVLGEARCSRPGFGGAGADGQGVVDCLGPGGYKLGEGLVWGRICEIEWEGKYIRWGGKSSP